MASKGKIILFLLLVFLAVAAIPSNMAFKLNYTLKTNSANNNTNWISIPYFDNYITANEILSDINTVDCSPGSVSQVKYFDTPNNSYLTYTGGGKNPPPVNPGVAYGIVATAPLCTWTLVGSHDDSYDSINGISFLTNIANNNLNWVSIPYHTQSANFNDLCTEINIDCSNVATQIKSFDVVNNVYVTYVCGGKNSPPIIPGEGLGVFVSSASTPACWHPSHY